MAGDGAEDNSRVTNRTLQQGLDHIAELMQLGFRQLRENQGDLKAEQERTNRRLDELNGNVRANRERGISDGARLEHLEKWAERTEAWRTGLLAAAFKYAAFGLGVGGGIGAIVYGIGHARGVW